MTDGDTAIYRTFLPGESLEVAAQRQMILTVSSPANIDFKLNGLPAKLADRSGRISNIVVTPANFRAFTGGIPTLIVDSVQLDSANAKSIDTPAQPNAEKSGAGGTGR